MAVAWGAQQKCKKTGNSRLFCKIDFPEIIAEEGEVYTVNLNEFIRGNLLTFDLAISQQGKNTTDWSHYINISESIQNRWTDPYGLHHSSFLHQEPFQSSSIFIQTEDNYQIVYFVDRNFHLYKYNVTFFQSDQIEFEYMIQLDTSIVNNTCGNLRELKLYNNTIRNLMMTCSGIKQNQFLYREWDVVQYIVIVDMSNDGDVSKEPLIQYFLVHSESSIRDDSFEILQIYRDDLRGDRLFVLQLCSQHQDLLIFEVHFNSSIQEVNFIPHGMIPFGDPDLFTQQAVQNLTKKLDSFVIIDKECGIIAILDQLNGIFITEYRSPISNFFANCHIDPNFPPIRSFIEHEDMQNLYYNDEDETTLFAAVAYPPKVIEIDISDLINPYIKKVYSLDGDQTKYVGMYKIASNDNYVVQTLLDMKNFDQVMRFYQRNSSHDHYAQFEVIIQDGFRSNFFGFPNYYIDKLIYRDERSLNLSQILPMRMHIDYRHPLDVNYYERLDANLTIYNNVGETLLETFKIQLMQRDDVTIVTKTGFVGRGPIYSCGDPHFKYSMRDVVSGPHYELEGTTDYHGGELYFKIINRRSSQIGMANLQKQLTLDYCDFTIMDTIMQQQDEMTHILICGQSSPGIIEKCEIHTDLKQNTSQLVHCNQTKKLINTQIENIYYDEQDKIIMVVANSGSPLNINGNTYYEMHFFEVGEYLIWKKVVMKGNFGQFQNLLISHYNCLIHMGTIVQNKGNEVLINIFNIDTKKYDTDLLINERFQIDETKNGTVFKAWISDQNFLWILFKNNTINTYEFEQCLYGNSTLRLVQSVYFDMTWDNYYPFLSVNQRKQYVPQEKQIICFDIMSNSQILVIYLDSGDAFVYEIQGFYTIQYKMQLPQYGPMINDTYTFIKNEMSQGRDLLKITKDSFVLIMVESKTNSSERHMLLYDVSQTKHDAYIYNITAPVIVPNRSALHLSCIGENAILSIFSNQQLALIELSFESYVIVDPDRKIDLINKCMDENSLTLMSKMMILQQTQIHVQIVHPSFNFLTANIYSVNQGLVIKTIMDSINITFANDGSPNFSNQGIILHQAFSGKDIQFQVECQIGTYDCNELIQQNTMPIISSSLIEFVTSSRQVIKKFTIGEYIFLLDSTIQLNLLVNVPPKQKHQNANVFDEASANNLIYLIQICQKQSFGCYMKQFSKDFDVMDTNLKSEKATFKKFFVIQCVEDTSQVQVIKFATVTLYKNFYSEKQPIMSMTANITFKDDFTTHIRAENDLIEIVKIDIKPIRTGLALADVEIIPMIKNNSQTLTMLTNITQSLYIALVFENQKQFTNYLQILQLDIAEDQQSFPPGKPNATMNILKTFQANNVGMATFIIKKLAVSLDKKYLFFTMDWFGIGIIDIQFQSFVYFIDFTTFYQKQTLVYDRSMTFQGIVQYSDDCWNVVFSKGIVKIVVNMERISSRMMFLEYTPYPLTMDYDYNYTFIQSSNYKQAAEIVNTKYGYILLNYKYINNEIFETYLGFISFQTERNSMFQNEIPLTRNIKCNSLQLQGSTLKVQQDKHINVTVVCGTMIFTAQFNIYPNININVHNLTDFRYKISDQESQDSSDFFGMTQMNISILANNNITKQVIPVFMKMSDESSNNFQLLYILLTLITAIVIMALIFINNKQSLQKDEDSGKCKRMSDHSKRDTITNFSRDSEFNREGPLKLSNEMKAQKRETQKLKSNKLVVKFLGEGKFKSTYNKKREHQIMEVIEEEDKEFFIHLQPTKKQD